MLLAALALGLLVPGALCAPVEIRALAGAQIDSDSHGEVDVGVRSGAWSAEVYTDTIDLRWSPTYERGRSWVAMRAEGFAAGLMITPWLSGGPEPEMAFLAGYAGPEAGWMRYLPAGWYAGLGGGVKVWFFQALEETVLEAPGPTFVGSGDAFLGVSRLDVGLSGWLKAGSHFVAPESTRYWQLPTYDAGGSGFCCGGWYTLPVGKTVTPYVSGELLWRRPGLVSPRVEVRAGFSDGVGAALATRVGGQMPYVVPLAGAAWGEFWASSYVAGRFGLAVGDGDAGPASGVGAETMSVPDDTRVRMRGMGLVDAVNAASVYETVHPLEESVAVSGPVSLTQVGFAGRVELRRKQFWLQTEAGWAPWVFRQEGIQNWAIMARVGMDWTETWPRRVPDPTIHRK